MKTISLIILSVLLLMSCDKQTTHSEDTGSISGKVVFAEGVNPYYKTAEPAAYMTVRIPGTSAYAYSDSAGKYLIYGLPEGVYDVEAYSYIVRRTGKIRDIIVYAGARTEAPDIVLGGEGPSNYYFSNLEIKNDEGQRLYFYYDENITDSKKVTFSAVLTKSTSSKTCPDTSISLKLNNTRYKLTTSKGWFKKELELKDGLNTIKLWIGHGAEPASVIEEIDIYYLTSINKIEIRLNWNTYNSQGYDDAGDFDIHLKNEQNGDVCWYKNYNPDWGVAGLSFDNPYLNDDENIYGSSSGYEYLMIRSASDGTYTLKVVYFSNHTDDSIKVRPQVRIRLKDGQEEIYTAPSEMSVGDEWTVCQITFPLTTTKPLNTIKAIDIKELPAKRGIKTAMQK